MPSCYPTVRRERRARAPQHRVIAAAAIALLLGLGLGLAPATQAQAADAAASAPASSAHATSAGHTFNVPEAFSVRTDGAVVTFESPEGDSKIFFVDVQAKTAAEAVKLGWAAVRPGFDRKLLLATPRAPGNGWAEQQVFDYETSPNEKVVVQAVAKRAGTAWVVVLIDGTEATFEKRGAPIRKAMSSLRPAGYQRESFAGRKPHPLDAERIAVLKEFLAKGMKSLDVPGVGFSLIDGNKVVFEGGLGVRALGKPERVDAHTLFMAASNTKAMSTVLLAQAVDAGRLTWDEPAHQANPAFKLADPALTEQVLVKNLVCACTGMPRQDLEWLFGNGKAPASTTFDQLATMKPTSHIGEVFQYSNLMVAAGGYIAAASLEPGMEVGAAYDKAMQERVLDPLGMKDSTLSIATATKRNHAEPHSEDVDGHTLRALMTINTKIAPARPAGAIWTSPHDFSRFVLMELHQGRNEQGQAIVSEQNLLKRYEPQVMVSEDVTYGMGLMVDKHDGITVVHHGGDLVGFHSDMIWLPEFGIGATILTNADAGVQLRGPFLRKLLELVFDGKPEADERLRVAALNRIAENKKGRERLTLPVPAADAAALASQYRSAELGDIKLKRHGGKLRFEFGDWASDVALLKNEDKSLSFVTIDPGLGGLEFVQASEAGKRSLIMRDAQHEYRFEEVVGAGGQGKTGGRGASQ